MKHFWKVLGVAVAAAALSGCQLIASAVGSDDNKLLSLVVKSHDSNDVSGSALTLYPDFSPEQTTYVAASGWNNTYSYSVSAKADSGAARVVVLGEDANVIQGINTLKVLVTAENGDRRTYVIYVGTAGIDVTAPANASLIGTLHVVNHSGVGLKDLRFGLTTSAWENNALFAGGETIADGASRDLVVYPGPLDIWAASEAGADASSTNQAASFVWDTYAADGIAGAHGGGRIIAVLPGQTVTYTIQ